MSRRCSPAPRESSSIWPTPSGVSRGCATANMITCRKRPSIWLEPSRRQSTRARSSPRRPHRSPVMATFHFELVSPERLVFAGEVSQVDVPGEEGEFGVLAGHAPYVATLRPGVLTIYGNG